MVETAGSSLEMIKKVLAQNFNEEKNVQCLFFPFYPTMKITCLRKK